MRYNLGDIERREYLKFHHSFDLRVVCVTGIQDSEPLLKDSCRNLCVEEQPG